MATLIPAIGSCVSRHGITHVLNPQEQARQYMFAVTNKLERDPQLIWPNGSLKGKPFFPYSHSVVFPNITRKQFDGANMGDVIPPHLVICQDEMTESADVVKNWTSGDGPRLIFIYIAANCGLSPIVELFHTFKTRQ